MLYYDKIGKTNATYKNCYAQKVMIFSSTLVYKCIIRGKWKTVSNKNKIFNKNEKVHNCIIKITKKFNPWWSPIWYNIF